MGAPLGGLSLPGRQLPADRLVAMTVAPVEDFTSEESSNVNRGGSLAEFGKRCGNELVRGSVCLNSR